MIKIVASQALPFVIYLPSYLILALLRIVSFLFRREIHLSAAFQQLFQPIPKPIPISSRRA